MMSLSSGIQTVNRIYLTDGSNSTSQHEILKAYPNPATGVVMINIPPDQFTRAKLIDANGRTIRQWSIKGKETRIEQDLSLLGNGYYILSLDGRGKSEAVKIIKQ